MWNFGRFLNARSTKIHSTVGCKNVLRVKIKVIQSKASKHFITVDSSLLENSENVNFCKFTEERFECRNVQRVKIGDIQNINVSDVL